MLEFLPQEVRQALAAQSARRQGLRRRRLSLHLGDAVFPIRRLWDSGFAVDADRLSRLRGFAEIHEGPTHLLSCLIVASQIENGELICTFKRATPASVSAALDYERDVASPVALLPPGAGA